MIRNHPLLQGVPNVDPNFGRSGDAAMLVTPSMLMATGQLADNTNVLHAIDKQTGERFASVPTPSRGQYGIMTYMHEGKQYVVLPVNGGYTALALP